MEEGLLLYTTIVFRGRRWLVGGSSSALPLQDRIRAVSNHTSSRREITYRLVFQLKEGKRLKIVIEVKNRGQMSRNRDP